MNPQAKKYDQLGGSRDDVRGGDEVRTGLSRNEAAQKGATRRSKHQGVEHGKLDEKEEIKRHRGSPGKGQSVNVYGAVESDHHDGHRCEE